MNSAVTFLHVSKRYGRKKTGLQALDDVSFEVPSGSFFGVIGSSGAGKSTLLRMVNGLERPTSGRVNALGRDPAQLGKRDLAGLRHDIGMIFQHYNLLQSKTVVQNVAIPLMLAHAAKDSIDRQVNKTLELVGLSDRAGAYPSQLSGGQCQRVGIARALVTNPKILLSDEATSALDPVTTVQTLDLLNRINAEYGITVLLITHQMSVISRTCQNVLVLEHGRIIEQGTVNDVFSHPQNPLTREFVESVIPRKIPSSVAARIKSGTEGTVLRIWYRNDAARNLLGDLSSLIDISSVSILHANENTLRGTIMGQLIIGLGSVNGEVLKSGLNSLRTDDRSFEVLHV